MDLRRKSRHFIAAIALLTALSLIPLSGLRFDFEIEDFFPVGDRDVEFFRDFQDRFFTQLDDEYIFIALRSEKGVFNRPFLEKADSLTRHLTSLENVIAVYSITNIPSVRIEEGKIVQAPLVHINSPELYIEDSINLYRSEEYRDLMFSKDGRTIAIAALNKPGLTDGEKDILLESINGLIEKLQFDRWHVAAKIKLEQAYTQEIGRNLAVYLLISTVLIAIILAILYRSFIGVALPLATIAIAICWTLGIIALMGFPLDIISSLLPPVLAVICMSGIIHLTSRYINELRKGSPKKEALQITIRETGLATFYTSLTTAVGFYSLSISGVMPIRTFGLFAGTGVMIAFFVGVALFLAIYSRVREPGIVRIEQPDRRWTSVLASAHDKLAGRKRTVAVLFALLLVPSAFYISRIEINSSLLQELPRHSPIHVDYEFIEKEFSGTRSFELALELKDTNRSFLHLDILHDIEEIEHFLKDSLGVGNLFSPVTFIKGAHRALSGGDFQDYRLPGHQEDVYVCFDKLLFSPAGRDMVRYITQDGEHARIGGKLPNLTMREFESLSKRFDRFLASGQSSFGVNCRMTGSALLLDKVSYSLVRNLFMGLAIGFLVISLIVALMLRSVKMVVIALVCNILPLLFVTAIMGAMGIYLKADTAVIFAISFGIVVDDTIHFLNGFKQERLRGKNVKEAVRASYLSTGKAMVITTVILIAGFISLTFSSFGGAFYIGFLVSLCLTLALVLDMTLLPVLILLWIKDA